MSDHDPEAELAKLWQEFRRAKSNKKRTRLRNQIAEHYLPLVRTLAARLSARIHGAMTADELASAGYEGLLRSIPLFDASLGYKPPTYFSPRIAGAMLDLLRSLDPVSRACRRRLPMVDQLREELGSEPTDAEIAKRLGIREADAGHYRAAPQTRSIYAPPMDTTGGEFPEVSRQCLATKLAAPAETTTHSREELDELLKGCSEIERAIVLGYYVDGLTMREIGLAFGVSESRVSQMHTATLARLRGSPKPTTRFAA